MNLRQRWHRRFGHCWRVVRWGGHGWSVSPDLPDGIVTMHFDYIRDCPCGGRMERATFSWRASTGDPLYRRVYGKALRLAATQAEAAKADINDRLRSMAASGGRYGDQHNVD